MLEIAGGIVIAVVVLAVLAMVAPYAIVILIAAAQIVWKGRRGIFASGIATVAAFAAILWLWWNLEGRQPAPRSAGPTYPTQSVASPAQSAAVPEPSTRQARGAAQPGLSVGERVTIGMACDSYQTNGDLAGYRQCLAKQMGIAAGTPAPSLDGLSVGERVTIGMACDSYQTNGDLAGYRECVRRKVAEAR